MGTLGPPSHVVRALSQGLALTRAQLVDLGTTDADLRRWRRAGMVVRPRSGYYNLAKAGTGDAAMDAELVALRGAVAAGPNVVVSHRSAARLWGLPVWGRRGPAEVTRRYGTAGIPGVRVHRYGVLEPEPATCLGLPTTTPARTVIDVCRTTSASAALATVDAAVRDLGLDVAHLNALLDTLRDVNFRARTKQVLSWADPLAENPFESFSRGQLLIEGIPTPFLQWWVGDGVDRWFRPDKLWPQLGLIAEADGRAKYRIDQGVSAGRERDPLVREKERHDWLTDRDFEIVRFGPERISRYPSEVADRWRTLAQRQKDRKWRWPTGVWLVEPGVWPPRRTRVRDESVRISRRAG